MFVLFSLVTCFSALQGIEAMRVCVKAGSKNAHISSGDDSKLLFPELETEEICPNGVSACYSYWKEVEGPNNSSYIKIIVQGCWKTSGNNNCGGEDCIAHRTKSEFCCCSSNLCNRNITRVEYQPEVTTALPGGLKQGSERSRETGGSGGGSGSGERLVVVVGAGLSLVLSIAALVALFRRWSPLKEKEAGARDSGGGGGGESGGSQSTNWSLATLNLVKIVGQGRYGTVWLGSVKDKEVAVKMFPQHYSQFFYNEKDIYTLPFMNHPSLLTYYGCDETKDELALFLSYCPMGTLQELLRSRPISLQTFCSLALTTAAGLAHLHTEKHVQDKWKPCVTHRDLNSRNILVREDLTCCLCDLGLAVKITGPRYFSLGGEMHAETKSINDVGTLRYMAPEVLEGAVNLRDCETSLKQIDVYALGLVLWEMAVRVTDFYAKPSEVSPYMLPFEKEVGHHPSLEEMQTAVCRHKARPLFPAEWRLSRASRLVRETVEDCTDQDGEARLTSLCAQERLAHLYRGTLEGGGVSPTFNQTGSNFNMTTMLNYNNNHISNNIGHNESEYTGDKEMTDGGVSVGTVETVVTMSPSESCPHLNSLVVGRGGEQRIQPYQGRNPCLERNLLCGGGSSEEVCIVESSMKDCRGRTTNSTCEETEALISSGGHRQPPHHPPIAYHQNSPFQTSYHHHPLKQTNVALASGGGVSSGPAADSFVSRLTVPLRRLLEPHLTVSPFETGPTPSPRPTSLQLFTDQEEEEEEQRIKELSGRIGTPGDLPPAVRKKRGERAARLSLYDDRIMSNSTF